MSKKRAAKTVTPRSAFLLDFFAGECCNQPMSTGYDVVMLCCKHNDYTSTEDNCYYAMCDVCGNMDTLCGKCVDEVVADNLDYWTRKAS
jgi:hypothetical protein